MARAGTTIKGARIAGLSWRVEFGTGSGRSATGRAPTEARIRGGAAVLYAPPPLDPRLLGELVAVRFTGLRREILRNMLLQRAATATAADLEALAARIEPLWAPIAARCNAMITALSKSLRGRLEQYASLGALDGTVQDWSRALDEYLLTIDAELHARLTTAIEGFEADIAPELLCASYEDRERYGAAVELLLANGAAHEIGAEGPASGLLGTTAHFETSLPLSLASLCLDFVVGFPADTEMRLVASHLRETARVEVEIVDGILRLATDYLAARDAGCLAALRARFPSCTTRRGG